MGRCTGQNTQKEFIFVQTKQSLSSKKFSFPQIRKLYFNLFTMAFRMTNAIIDESKPFNIEKSTDATLLIASMCISILEILPTPYKTEVRIIISKKFKFQIDFLGKPRKSSIHSSVFLCCCCLLFQGQKEGGSILLLLNPFQYHNHTHNPCFGEYPIFCNSLFQNHLRNMYTAFSTCRDTKCFIYVNLCNTYTALDGWLFREVM